MNGRGRPHASAERDLRGQLLRASRELLDEGGLAMLSLREVARRSGCTHQAPYHYFTNREALLAALVAEGFNGLANMLQAARATVPPGDVAGIQESTANAYIEFALRNPGIFRLMFRIDVCDPERHPEVAAAGDRAWRELRDIPDTGMAGAPAELLASARWAHVHGLATLLLDGPLALSYPTLEEKLAHAAKVNGMLMPNENPVAVLACARGGVPETAAGVEPPVKKGKRAGGDTK